MLNPVRLRTEYKQNPIGMDEKCPRFSYELNGNSKYQTAYRILVEDEQGSQMWDSGFVQDSRSLQIEYKGATLKPFTRYNWKVQVRDENGVESYWSAGDSFFETGFLGTEWSGKWLSASSGPLSRLLRDFKLEKTVAKARLYATALGVYEIYVNGNRVGEDCLKPGWTDYFERVQYQAYDVTELLQKGDNTLASTVTGGWFSCKGYGNSAALLAELHITYADGSTEKIVTGKDWKRFYVHIQNPIRFSHLYNGEAFEAWEETDWKQPGGYRTYAVAAPETDIASHAILKTIKVVWQSGADIRRMIRMEPVKIKKRPNATWIVDFGQNFTGWERIHLKNTMQGTTIVIKHGEMLNPDGSLYVENLRNAWQRTIYTTGTHDEEIYEPQFTYYGFRYLEISGWQGDLTKDQICAFAVYSNLEQTGSFQCSEPMLNKLYENIVWGQRSNFLDVPTDCPQRDERHGWTGDTQVFANMATYNMECGDFYTKWIEDLNLGRSSNGSYPHVAPKMAIEPHLKGATGWADAGIVCPHIMQTKYADNRIVRKYFANMVRWLDWQIENAGGSFLVNNALFGDWLNIDAMIDNQYLSTAYLGGMTKLLAQMAVKIGENSEAQRLEEMHRSVKKAFGEAYFSPDGELQEKTQTAAVLAIHFGLCPDETAHRRTIEYLKQDIVTNRNLHLSTGFLGTPLLLRTLTEAGELDLAYDLLLQTTYPGWLYPVTQGATTMWERWTSWTEENGFGDPEMNSFNHYAYGAVGDWFFETICGIQPMEDGFKAFRLAPLPGKRLTHAEAVYHSAYGEIRSAWKNDDGTFTWDFTVPVNTTAAVQLPPGMIPDGELPDGLTTGDGKTFSAGPGSYQLQFKAAE